MFNNSAGLPSCALVQQDTMMIGDNYKCALIPSVWIEILSHHMISQNIKLALRYFFMTSNDLFLCNVIVVCM